MDNYPSQKAYHKGRKRSSQIGLLLFSAAVGWGIATHAAMRYRDVPLSALHWERPPVLLTVSDVQRNGQSGSLLVRPTDGKEQFLPGAWRLSFSESGVYAFPESSSSADRPEQRLYFFEGNEHIREITINNLPGSLRSVRESPSRTHLVLEVTKEFSTIFCVTERFGTAPPACQQLGVGAVAESVWNPAQDRELVIRTETGSILTFDPLEKKPRFVDAKTDHARHEELSRLFQRHPAREGGSAGAGGPSRAFRRFLNLVFVLDKQGNRRVARVPLGARVALFGDDEHLLAVQPGRLDIIELSSRSRSPLARERGIGSGTVRYRTGGSDIVLRGAPNRQ